MANEVQTPREMAFEDFMALRAKLADTEKQRQYAETDRDKLILALGDLLERHYDAKHDTDTRGADCQCFPYSDHAALLAGVKERTS